jgi:hypothetical protein
MLRENLSGLMTQVGDFIDTSPMLVYNTSAKLKKQGLFCNLIRNN